MIYQRPYLKTLKSRVDEPRKFIQTIIGPRQVGKTTLVNQLTKQIDIPFLYLSADNVIAANTIWIEQQWEIARIQLKNSKASSFLLIIDEIQKINNWSSTIKALWDSDTFNNVNIKVILLGSATLVLQKGLTESLAGRFEVINVSHWSFTEMQEAFDLTAQQYAWFGGYPGAVALINDEYRWKEYIKNSLIETTISKDILMLNRVNKPTLLKRLFELGTTYSGQVLSYSKMIGQLQDAGNTTTLSHYLNLLDSAGMLCGIEKIYVEKHFRKSSSPKFQVKNTAFIAALSNKDFNQIIKEPNEWGRIIESVIGAHLVNNAITQNYKVYYWRHRNDEVDFILQKGNKIIGLEVKSGSSKVTKGMMAFKKKFNPEKVLIVGNTGIKWEEFLTIKPENLFY